MRFLFFLILFLLLNLWRQPVDAQMTVTGDTAVHKADSIKPLRNKQILFFQSSRGLLKPTGHLAQPHPLLLRFSRTIRYRVHPISRGLSLYSIKKQFITAVTGTQYFAKEKYILYEQLSYSYFPDKFWGLGRYAPDSAEESYIFKQYYITPHLMRNIGHDLYIGVLYELQRLMQVDYKAGGIFDQQDIAGRTPYLISGLGASFTYDTRNNAFAPDKGYFAQLYFNHFGKYLGSDYAYTNIVIDLRTFIPTKWKQVLALQAYSFNNLGDRIPLRSLATLGGNNSMRGYYDGRFRDKDQFVLQAEYRIPVYWRFGAVAFADAGDVSHTPFNYSFSDIKYSYGAGIRFSINRTERLNVRLDYGIGGNGNHGLYFQLGEAF